eukprot:CAMPEP_0204318346 /NCGR_PEP_ID=MMETSP0469-20131031/6485_1 /ASSEMBLY_ACC=CAM_ASM_000384 /TAXON_ID=2969 /ORGANISM="Oxyrrhis marina" /LENGTH=89 /DNA_ID=CAMNT_0051299387 /DNA_START=282 /DNA_END=547 /DNA_ORIENTATION=+
MAKPSSSTPSSPSTEAVRTDPKHCRPPGTSDTSLYCSANPARGLSANRIEETCPTLFKLNARAHDDVPRQRAKRAEHCHMAAYHPITPP